MRRDKSLEEVYILDAVNYLFRSYYAIGPMTNDKGQSTNALYGFIRSVHKVLKDFQPKHLICVFDGPENIKGRKEIYPEYKAHRKKAPDDLYQQMSVAYDYCEMAGIPALSIPGVEADDTMATIALWAAKGKAKVFLCTSDKDLFQLISDQIFVLNVYKNNLFIDAEKVQELYGVPPSQMLDLLSIMGDSSDNIPGIPGLGPKSAAGLLKEFGSLENLLSHPEKVSSEKRRKLLTAYKDQAILSKKLASLHTQVDIPTTDDFYEIKPPDRNKLEALYHEMKFLTLLQELPPVHEIKEISKVEYTLIESLDQLQKLLTLLSGENEICLDTETTGIRPLTAELVGLGLCAKAGVAYYIPYSKEALQLLRPFLENPNLSFYGHNFKYDYHVLSNYGVTISRISFDTMLASYLLTPQNRRHNLDEIVLQRFNKAKIPIASLIGTGKKEICMRDVPVEKVCEYCCEDVDYTFRLKKLFEKELLKENLHTVFRNIELPLLPILAKMERAGIFLDTYKMGEMSKALQEQLSRLQKEIFIEVGEEFNINSPKQLSEILYQRLGLKPPLRKKSQYATDAKVLEMLAEENAVASHILEYRGLEKLQSTYASSLPEEVNPITHRIHCTFNQSVAATGRLSCQNPNLQNIPLHSTEGKKIREGFRPQKAGWRYLSFDYSQIELRLLAHFSKDPVLIRAFQEGQDVHTYTASLIFGIPFHKITPQMRQQAKAVNFGILYGQSAFGLSQELKIPVKEASDFIRKYFSRYPKVQDYLEHCKDEVREKGYAITLTGRKRPIPEIHSKNPHIKAAAERLAINTPLQGTAADSIKLAMIEIDKDLRQKKVQGFLIVQVHDELLFEVPGEEVEIFSGLVKEKMEGALFLDVPLTVEIEVGNNWGEC